MLRSTSLPLYFCTQLLQPLTPIGRSVILLGHTHPCINRCAERRKAGTSNSGSLGSAIPRKDRARHTPRGNPIRHIVLRPEPLDTALDSAEEGADGGKVLGCAPRALAHVFEADAQLLAPGQGAGRGGGAGAGSVIGGVVGHLDVWDITVRFAALDVKKGTER